MTHEKALALSVDLVKAGIPHTIGVGIYEEMAQSVQASVDVHYPRRIVGGVAAAVTEMERIGAIHGLVLVTSMLNDGLSFSTPEAVTEFTNLAKIGKP